MLIAERMRGTAVAFVCLTLLVGCAATSAMWAGPVESVRVVPAGAAAMLPDVRAGQGRQVMVQQFAKRDERAHSRPLRSRYVGARHAVAGRSSAWAARVVVAPPSSPRAGADNNAGPMLVSGPDGPGAHAADALSGVQPRTAPEARGGHLCGSAGGDGAWGACVAGPPDGHRGYQDRLIEPEPCEIKGEPDRMILAPVISKPGAVLFVSAPLDTTLCVVDADGQRWSHRFARGAGQSFHGAAPWFLKSPYLSEMEIHHQGWRLDTIEHGVESVQLVLRPGP